MRRLFSSSTGMALLPALAGLLHPLAVAGANSATRMPPAGARPLTNLTFVAFDVETTGFSTNTSRMVELGAVRIGTSGIEATTNWLINPGIPIPYRASAVHGITDDRVAGQPGFGKILPAFKRFVGDAVLLAHNARFDIRFVRAGAHRAGLDTPTNTVLDTLHLARACFPDAPAHSLKAIAKHLDIAVDRAHRADADSVLVATLLLRAIRSPGGPRTLEELTERCGGRLSF